MVCVHSLRRRVRKHSVQCWAARMRKDHLRSLAFDRSMEAYKVSTRREEQEGTMIARNLTETKRMQSCSNGNNLPVAVVLVTVFARERANEQHHFIPSIL